MSPLSSLTRDPNMAFPPACLLLTLCTARKILDAELRDERRRERLEARRLAAERPADEQNAGHDVGIHAVITAPCVGIVRQDIAGHHAERRIVGSARAPGVADNEVRSEEHTSE